MFEETLKKKPYNSRIINNCIKLIEQQYSHIDVDALLDYAGMESYQVADPGHWFTAEQVDLFYEKAVQATGNRSIAREAGRFFSSPTGDINIFQQIFLSILDPVKAFKRVEKIAPVLTRYSEYKTTKLNGRSVEIVYRVHPSVGEKPHQCDNRMGMMEAVSRLTSLKKVSVDHPECLFKGDDSCRYIVRWEDSPSGTMKKILWGSALGLALFNGINCLVPWGIPIVHSFSGSVVAMLSLCLLAKHREIKKLNGRSDIFQHSADNFLHQIDVNYNTTVIARKVSEVINSKMTVEETAEGTMEAIRELLEFDRGMILLADKEKTKLRFVSGYGYDGGFRKVLDSAVFSLTDRHSSGVFAASFREQRPYYIDNPDAIEMDTGLRSIGAGSFICCPIVCDSVSLGVLSVDSLHTGRPLFQSDISLLMGIASIVGVGIRKIQLAKGREYQLQSIIKVLASSIDARDPLTAGHSEKVAEYADEICRRMGLSARFRDTIHIASLLHDYGKIGVPDSILKKNGQLTAEEFDIIKTHVVKTLTILNQINFEGDLADIPEIAASHHEQIDGGGYPMGLKGNQIPLGAKIIAVADFFDAITSRRHYRNPMTLEGAVATLKAEAGWHLDPEVVDVFCSYLEDNRVKVRKEYTVLREVSRSIEP